jgi:hypothetical protein
VLQRYTIHIFPEVDDFRSAGLLPILESILPIKFRVSDTGRVAEAGRIILEDAAAGQLTGTSIARVPSLRVPRRRHSSTDDKLIDVTVHFEDHAHVPFPFRARTVCTKVAEPPVTLSLSDDETALAKCERGIVWATSDKTGVRHFKSGFDLPKPPAGGCLTDVLNGDRFLEILPLLHFLHAVCQDRMLEGPSLRACFMFDDPNLHWYKYGRIDFRQIAVRAAKINYHVAFATVPLDAWYTHKATAKLFRNSGKWLSLLIHGNNHTHMELARDYTDAQRISLLNQAIFRIQYLERKAGIEVARVMAAPHGACSEPMLEDLPRCGFEGATISHGSLRAHNKTRTWIRSIGYQPSELIGGCPILPRWRLSGDATNRILLAAYLKQPIILVGHHHDLRDGTHMLDHLAGFINNLGDVVWRGMGRLCRQNYQWKVNGNVLRVRPLGRNLSICVPEGVSHLLIENLAAFGDRRWRVSCPEGKVLKVFSDQPVVLPNVSQVDLCLELDTGGHAFMGGSSGVPAPWALLRRLLTELRDRFIVSS